MGYTSKIIFNRDIGNQVLLLGLTVSNSEYRVGKCGLSITCIRKIYVFKSTVNLLSTN
jgi:hypothetical protein